MRINKGSGLYRTLKNRVVQLRRHAILLVRAGKEVLTSQVGVPMRNRPRGGRILCQARRQAGFLSPLSLCKGVLLAGWLARMSRLSQLKAPAQVPNLFSTIRLSPAFGKGRRKKCQGQSIFDDHPEHRRHGKPVAGSRQRRNRGG